MSDSQTDISVLVAYRGYAEARMLKAQKNFEMAEKLRDAAVSEYHHYTHAVWDATRENNTKSL